MPYLTVCGTALVSWVNLGTQFSLGKFFFSDGSVTLPIDDHKQQLIISQDDKLRRAVEKNSFIRLVVLVEVSQFRNGRRQRGSPRGLAGEDPGLLQLGRRRRLHHGRSRALLLNAAQALLHHAGHRQSKP